MPKRQPPAGCEPGEVRVARGNIDGTRVANRDWYQHFRDRLANKFRFHESALEKGLYLNEFNGRLTFVTVTHVDDLFYAYDTRSKTTKSLLVAIVKEFNMSRKQDDFVFLWQTCSCYTRSLARQKRICGLILPMELWTSAICRNHVDIQRTQRISQFVWKTPMVATSITSRSVV